MKLFKLFRALFQGKKAEPQKGLTPSGEKTQPIKPATRHSQPHKVSQYSRGRGELLNVYPSVSAAARQTGVKRQSIQKCCKGEQKHAGGFKWYYVD